MKKLFATVMLLATLQFGSSGVASAALSLVMGAVNANGTLQVPSSAYSVRRVSAGRYTITFAPATFNNAVPICMVLPLGRVQVYSLWENVNTCDVLIINSVTGTAADAIFNFQAAPITR